MKNKRGIELLFWAMALTVVLFINISPEALKNTNPAFLVVLFVALLVIFSVNFAPNRDQRKARIVFSAVVYLVVFFALFLFLTGRNMFLVYYYLPVVIAVTMAFIVMAKPRGPITLLVAVCTFLLGEAFWNINIGQGNKVVFPPAFVSIYSLSLVALFGYYLYSREVRMQAEMIFLNERLRKLDDLKSKFVANVSHELRTPLTSIKNACAILKKTAADQQSKDMLGIIDSNVDRQARLVSNLLDLAKIEKGVSALPRGLVDMCALARQVVNSLSMQANKKGINIEFSCEQDLSGVYGSSDQILEVYTNLIDNAIKYTPERGNVSVKLEKYQEGVKTTISDSGMGIKKEDIGKLFERFKRLETILENRGKGAGLGLAITKEIIDIHGGKIWVESSYGSGSSFIFTMPFSLRRRS